MVSLHCASTARTNTVLHTLLLSLQPIYTRFTLTRRVALPSTTWTLTLERPTRFHKTQPSGVLWLPTSRRSVRRSLPRWSQCLIKFSLEMTATTPSVRLQTRLHDIPISQTARSHRRIGFRLGQRRHPPSRSQQRRTQGAFGTRGIPIMEARCRVTSP